MKSRFTSIEALQIVQAHQGLVKTVYSDHGDDEHWDFLLNQFEDPETVRPIRSLDAKADRSQVLDLYTQKWKTRQIPTNHIRGGHKPNKESIKATSASLIPPDGRMRLYNHSKTAREHENVAILFDAGTETDPKKSIVKHCFPKDSGTDAKFWIKGQALMSYHNGVIPKAITLTQLRANNASFSQKIKSGSARDHFERNEARIKPRKRDIFAVAALSSAGSATQYSPRRETTRDERINALYRKVHAMHKLRTEEGLPIELAVIILDDEGVKDYPVFQKNNKGYSQVSDIVKALVEDDLEKLHPSKGRRKTHVSALVDSINRLDCTKPDFWEIIEHYRHFLMSKMLNHSVANYQVFSSHYTQFIQKDDPIEEKTILASMQTELSVFQSKVLLPKKVSEEKNIHENIFRRKEDLNRLLQQKQISQTDFEEKDAELDKEAWEQKRKLKKNIETEYREKYGALDQKRRRMRISRFANYCLLAGQNFLDQLKWSELISCFQDINLSELLSVNNLYKIEKDRQSKKLAPLWIVKKNEAEKLAYLKSQFVPVYDAKDSDADKQRKINAAFDLKRKAPAQLLVTSAEKNQIQSDNTLHTLLRSLHTYPPYLATMSPADKQKAQDKLLLEGIRSREIQKLEQEALLHYGQAIIAKLPVSQMSRLACSHEVFYQKMLDYFKNQIVVTFAFKGETFFSDSGGLTSLKVLNVFENLNGKGAGYQNQRRTAENKQFEKIPKDLLDYFKKHESARPRYAALRLMDKKNLPHAFNSYGYSFVVFHSSILLSMLFTPKNAMGSYGQVNLCTYHHPEILLNQLLSSDLYQIAHGVDPSAFPAPAYSNEIQMEAYFPPINLLDNRVVSHLHVYESEYKLTADDKVFLEGKGISYTNERSDNPYQLILDKFEKCIEDDDIDLYKNLLKNHSFIPKFRDEPALLAVMKKGSHRLFRYLVSEQKQDPTALALPGQHFMDWVPQNKHAEFSAVFLKPEDILTQFGDIQKTCMGMALIEAIQAEDKDRLKVLLSCLQKLSQVDAKIFLTYTYPALQKFYPEEKRIEIPMHEASEEEFESLSVGDNIDIQLSEYFTHSGGGYWPKINWCPARVIDVKGNRVEFEYSQYSQYSFKNSALMKISLTWSELRTPAQLFQIRFPAQARSNHLLMVQEAKSIGTICLMLAMMASDDQCFQLLTGQGFALAEVLSNLSNNLGGLPEATQNQYGKQLAQLGAPVSVNARLKEYVNYIYSNKDYLAAFKLAESLPALLNYEFSLGLKTINFLQYLLIVDKALDLSLLEKVIKLYQDQGGLPQMVGSLGVLRLAARWQQTPIINSLLNAYNPPLMALSEVYYLIACRNNFDSKAAQIDLLKGLNAKGPIPLSNEQMKELLLASTVEISRYQVFKGFRYQVDMSTLRIVLTQLLLGAADLDSSDVYFSEACLLLTEFPHILTTKLSDQTPDILRKFIEKLREGRVQVSSQYVDLIQKLVQGYQEYAFPNTQQSSLLMTLQDGSCAQMQWCQDVLQLLLQQGSLSYRPENWVNSFKKYLENHPDWDSTVVSLYLHDYFGNASSQASIFSNLFQTPASLLKLSELKNCQFTGNQSVLLFKHCYILYSKNGKDPLYQKPLVYLLNQFLDSDGLSHLFLRLIKEHELDAAYFVTQFSKKSFDLHRVDQDGNTALHYLIKEPKSCAPLLELLCTKSYKGCNNHLDESPLSFAFDKKDKVGLTVARFLLKRCDFDPALLDDCLCRIFQKQLASTPDYLIQMISLLNTYGLTKNSLFSRKFREIFSKVSERYPGHFDQIFDLIFQNSHLRISLMEQISFDQLSNAEAKLEEQPTQRFIKLCVGKKIHFTPALLDDLLLKERYGVFSAICQAEPSLLNHSDLGPILEIRLLSEINNYLSNRKLNDLKVLLTCLAKENLLKRFQSNPDYLKIMSENEDLDGIFLLLDYGFKVVKPEIENDLALSFTKAYREQHVVSIQKLNKLREKLCPFPCDALDAHQKTSLHYAIEAKQSAQVNHLLSLGAKLSKDKALLFTLLKTELEQALKTAADEFSKAEAYLKVFQEAFVGTLIQPKPTYAIDPEERERLYSFFYEKISDHIASGGRLSSKLKSKQISLDAPEWREAIHTKNYLNLANLLRSAEIVKGVDLDNQQLFVDNPDLITELAVLKEQYARQEQANSSLDFRARLKRFLAGNADQEDNIQDMLVITCQIDHLSLEESALFGPKEKEKFLLRAQEFSRYYLGLADEVLDEAEQNLQAQKKKLDKEAGLSQRDRSRIKEKFPLYLAFQYLSAKLDARKSGEQDWLNTRLKCTRTLSRVALLLKKPEPRLAEDKVTRIIKVYHQNKWHLFGRKNWAISQSEASRKLLKDLEDTKLSDLKKYQLVEKYLVSRDASKTTLAKVLRSELCVLTKQDVLKAEKDYQASSIYRLRNWLKVKPTSQETQKVLLDLKAAESPEEKYRILYKYLMHPETKHKRFAETIKRLTSFTP